MRERKSQAWLQTDRVNPLAPRAQGKLSLSPNRQVEVQKNEYLHREAKRPSMAEEEVEDT